MRRIAVVGTSGSGKTTLARQLAQRLGVPFVEEDALLRLVWRTFRRVATRAELWSGNRERWWVAFFTRESLLWYAFRTFKEKRHAYAALFAQAEYAHLTVIRLRSSRAARAWVSGILVPRLRRGSWQIPPAG